MNTYKSVRNTSVFNRAICKNLFYFLCYYVDPWECHSGIDKLSRGNEHVKKHRPRLSKVLGLSFSHSRAFSTLTHLGKTKQATNTGKKQHSMNHSSDGNKLCTCKRINLIDPYRDIAIRVSLSRKIQTFRSYVRKGREKRILEIKNFIPFISIV